MAGQQDMVDAGARNYREVRRALLATTALIAISAASIGAARANGVTAPGASTTENAADHIYVRNSSGGTTSVDASTADLMSTHAYGVGVDNTGGGTGAAVDVTVGAGITVQSNDFAGVFGISTAAPITVTNNGAVRGDTAYGVFLDSSYGAGATGAVVLKGSGTVWSNETAIYVDTWNAPTAISGLSQITGKDYGVYVLAETDSGKVGAVTLGTVASPLASITATTGKGIYVDQQDGPVSAGDINMHVGAVTAGDNAIEVQNYGSSTNIVTTGLIKSANASGIYVSPTTGSTVVDGSGTSTVQGGSAWYGIGIETGGAGAITIKDYVSVSGASQGVRAVAGAGAVTIQNIASVTGVNDFGIYASQGDNAGPVAITGIGSVSAPSAVGIYVAQGNNGGAVTIGVDTVSSEGNAIEVQNYDSTTNIATTGLIKSTTASGIYVSPTTGSTVVDGSGTSTVQGGSAWYGIGVETGGAGAITIKDYVSVSGASQGVRAVAGAGAVTIQNIASVTGVNDFGIYASQGDNAGPVAITGIGSVSAPSAVGIYVAQGNNGGAVTIGVDTISSEGNAIEVQNYTSATTIDTTGAIVSSAGNGIYASPTTGAVAIDGAGTSTVQALHNAVMVDGSSTSVAVTNYAALTGGDSGVYVPSAGGTVSVQGNGDIKGLAYYGIQATTSAGDIDIGNLSSNGNILGNLEGVTARNTGTGNIHIVNDAGKTIQGLYGVTTRTTTGTAIIDNAGTIQTGTVSVAAFPNYTFTYDSGAASVPGGALAIHQEDGVGVTNNTGAIVGSITTAGASYVLNNNAGGVWTPGLTGNAFDAASNAINNAGLINVRSGATTFSGAHTLYNLSGGVIDLQYGPAATDTLNLTNLATRGGSAIRIDVDFTTSNGAGDSGGQGASDTIVVSGVSTPTGASLVVVNSLTSAPGTLTGSVAVVKTTATSVAAPGAGVPVASSAYYTLSGSLPDTGKYKYTLVDDGSGGVYLVWQPNLTADSLGAYLGGPIGASSSAASAIATANGAFGGLDLLGGGGPLRQISNMTAASASSSRVTAACAAGRRWNSWAAADGYGSSSTGGGSNSARGFNGGVERDLGEIFGAGCGRVAAGVFGYLGANYSTWSNGAAKSNGAGGGVFVRAATEGGFYGAVAIAFGRSGTDKVNGVFHSTAHQSAATLGGMATFGKMTAITDSDRLDARAFVTAGRVDGRAFMDSAGIIIDGSQQKLRTYGASFGWHHAFAPNLETFASVGVKRVNLDSSMSAFGNTTVKGSVSKTYGTAEAGVSGHLGAGVTLEAAGFGDFASGARGLGGRARLAVSF